MSQPRLAVGLTQTRTLAVLSSTGSQAVGAGTYTLLGPDGAAVSGCSGLTVTAGAVSVPVPSGLTLGPGYIEVWSVTIANVARVWRVAATMQMWALLDDEGLVAGGHVVARYPYMASVLASGQSSWEQSAYIAHHRVMGDADRRMATVGGSLTDRTALVWPAIEALCAEVWRVLGAHGNPVALEMADRHELAYASWWETMSAGVDTNGDGAADTQRAPAQPAGAVL